MGGHLSTDEARGRLDAGFGRHHGSVDGLLFWFWCLLSAVPVFAEGVGATCKKVRSGGAGAVGGCIGIDGGGCVAMYVLPLLRSVCLPPVVSVL